MTPEQEARLEIDALLAACGWQVQDFRSLHLSAAPGIAVREFPLATGHADYLLFAQGRAIGSVEAKPFGHSLTGTEGQARKYTEGLDAQVAAYGRPLPFHFESTGVETRFTNLLDPEPRSRGLFAFHTPAELIRLAGLDRQLRDALQHLPPLNTTGLWPVQVQAVQRLEQSLADSRPRSLIQMATGSGKTFTAATFCYRLVKHAGARRILFLVDRNNLGRQALREIGNYQAPDAARPFAEEFNIQHLRSQTIAEPSRLCISTVQRLFSMLRGTELDEAIEEESLFEAAQPATKEIEPIAYNPSYPISTFDFIVIDECHRSIYNQWRQVLDYFDASLIGLTATPTAQTIGFFDQNLVMEYGHQAAVADGINVDYQVYRIRTKITEQGATIEGQPGFYIPVRDRRTRQVRHQQLDDDLVYTAGQLDRDVQNPNQIRTVIRAFRERLFTDIFPGRTEVPKTLVFAKDDNHAEEITKIIREEFGRGNEFCQKITYKTTGARPEDLLQAFRVSYLPRIVVTVDMISTGTDVKPLECLLFLRMIHSAGYFEQMKGRGVRVVSPDDLATVTPHVRAKTHFVIVDAVGVCEHDKSESQPLDRKPTVSLKDLLSAAAQGSGSEDLASSLASRLLRLEQEMTPEQLAAVRATANGNELAQLAAGLLDSIDPDRQAAAAEAAAARLGRELTEREANEVRAELVREALTPFHNPDLRQTILAIRQQLEQIIDESNPDEVLEAGFSAAALDRARSLIGSFRQFCEEHKDRIEALRILYSRPYRAGLRYRHVRELAALLKANAPAAEPAALWAAYQQVEPERVRGVGGKQLADLVALVKHAVTPDEPLVPVAETVEERYRAWLGEQTAAGVEFTAEQRAWLDAIKDHIAASLHIDEEDFYEVPFSQLGGLGKVYSLFGERLRGILDELNGRLAA
ncbi:MAG: DEAD/DEAH box helicase family protein [Fimbriimonadaceae bacterium]|nr:DEAD/DEAH box helicase family protein [Fimbriimonadaceae bacterium]